MEVEPGHRNNQGTGGRGKGNIRRNRCRRNRSKPVVVPVVCRVWTDIRRNRHGISALHLASNYKRLRTLALIHQMPDPLYICQSSTMNIPKNQIISGIEYQNLQHRFAAPDLNNLQLWRSKTPRLEQGPGPSHPSRILKFSPMLLGPSLGKVGSRGS